jgi:hypothetical protein
LLPITLCIQQLECLDAALKHAGATLRSKTSQWQWDTGSAQLHIMGCN